MIDAIDDKIIVEYLRVNTTEGGLIVPEGTHEPQGYGKVLSVGNNVKGIKKGVILVFHTRGGMDMILKNKVHKCIKYDEVYGILTDKQILKRLEPLEMVIKESIITPPEKKIIV